MGRSRSFEILKTFINMSYLTNVEKKRLLELIKELEESNE